MLIAAVVGVRKWALLEREGILRPCCLKGEWEGPFLCLFGRERERERERKGRSHSNKKTVKKEERKQLIFTLEHRDVFYTFYRCS